LDKSKRVQQAAVSAVAQLLEQGQARMINYIPDITKKLTECLQRYKLKNLPFLFDCLMVLLTYFHEIIQKNRELFQRLIDIAVRRMMCLDDDQPAVFGVVEFLTNIAGYLGPQFHRWAPMIWDRCITVATNYLDATRIAEQHKANNQDYDFPRIQNFTITVDMLSSIIEALEGDVQQYINVQDLLKIIEGGVTLSIQACRRVTFGLLSVLVDPSTDPVIKPNCTAISKLDILEQHMEKLIPLAINNLTPHNEQLFVNAAYFLGQTTKRKSSLIKPFLESLLTGIAGILKMPEPPQMNVPFGGAQIGPSHHTFCSAAFTMARLAYSFQDEVASVFSQFAIEWTYHLGRCAEDEEKDFAFRVLLQFIQQNPMVFLNSPIGVSVLCNSLASWWEVSEAIVTAGRKIVTGFKEAITQNGGNWEEHMGRMDPSLVESFRNSYKV